MTFEYSPWLIIPSAAASAAAAWWLYRSNPLRLEGKTGVLVQRILMGVRFAVLFILALLLTGPVSEWITERTQKPVLVIASDNSQSVAGSREAAYYKSNFQTELNEFKRLLESDFEVVHHTFDEQLNARSTPAYDGKITDISKTLTQISNRYESAQLGAVVLISDGLYNRGDNPLYSSADMAVPIFTVLLGDTVAPKDARIKNVRCNQVAFTGNNIAIQVDVAADNCSGQSAVLSISHNGNTLAQKNISYTGSSFFETHTLTIPALGEGSQIYRIKVSAVSGEKTTQNNVYEAYVNIISNRQRVLLLAFAPHPDLGAMKKMIEATEGYSCEVQYINDLSDMKPTNAYSLVVLHQLPGWRGEGQKLIEEFKSRNTPLLYVLGSMTGLNVLTALEPAFRIQFRNQSSNEALANVNEQFGLFILDETEKNVLTKFPPLLSPFATYSVAGDYEALLTQQIGYVKTNYPLWFFLKSATQRSAFICGEGIWRWHLADFQLNNQQTVTQLIQKTIQYLSTRKDNARFRLLFNNRYEENETITADAEVYNESYETIQDADVRVTIKNSAGKEYTYALSAQQNRYTLQAGVLTPGKYTYTATATRGSEQLKTSGSFYVVPLQLEQTENVAHAQLMRELAAQTGGYAVQAHNLNTLAEAIQQHDALQPIVYTGKERKSWIDVKWIFYVLLTLLTLEWGIRKWNGSV
ncbi:MAG: hypothetical protein ACK5HJ_10680 [Bacteroidota bacterium]|jgi:hypothetical protein